MYRDVTSVKTSSRISCGLSCARNASCTYFLFHIQTLSCHLLAYNVDTTPLDLNFYLNWDVFKVPNNNNCNNYGIYLTEFNKCIGIHTDVEKTWNDSQTYCLNDGGSLMTINSDSEFDYFRSLFTAMLKQPEFFNLGAKKIGPGFNDFHWVFGSTVGARISSSHWYLNMPDNKFGDEFCIASRWDDNFYLNDVTCLYYPGFFICEYLV